VMLNALVMMLFFNSLILSDWKMTVIRILFVLPGTTIWYPMLPKEFMQICYCMRIRFLTE